MTGIAGFTLGGGFGWVHPKIGLGCDSLKSATVVTADGNLVTANEADNRECNLTVLRHRNGPICEARTTSASASKRRASQRHFFDSPDHLSNAQPLRYSMLRSILNQRRHFLGM
jgi:FAD/FMN-containing dehydrogenase